MASAARGRHFSAGALRRWRALTAKPLRAWPAGLECAWRTPLGEEQKVERMEAPEVLSSYASSEAASSCLAWWRQPRRPFRNFCGSIAPTCRTGNERHAALGGDIVDDPDLLSLVTPTSSDAEGALSVSGTVLDPFSAEFTISWAGSDAGVAAYLAWYEGDTLLDERLQIGPWSETITVLITSTGPIEDVELRPSGATVSLP